MISLVDESVEPEVVDLIYLTLLDECISFEILNGHGIGIKFYMIHFSFSDVI